MLEAVSVDDALLRGKRMVSYPVLLILVGLPAIAVYFFLQFQINGWLTTGTCIAGFICAWLYWSFAIPRWRLWAFANVRNVHELTEKAIKEQLFAVSDSVEDDLSIPEVTEIYFSKSKSIGAIVMGMLFFGMGFYLYSEDGPTWVSWMAFIMGPGIVIYGFFNLRNRNPQITLSDDGIKLANGDFYNWTDVKGEGIEVISGNGAGGGYFTFFTIDGRKSVDIAELGIKRAYLYTLLRVYRVRSNKKL